MKWIRGNLLKGIDDYVPLRGINTTVVYFGRKLRIDQMTCLKLYFSWETFVGLYNTTFYLYFLSLYSPRKKRGKQMFFLLHLSTPCALIEGLFLKMEKLIFQPNYALKSREVSVDSPLLVALDNFLVDRHIC
jgi:hypothetical protein